MVSEKPQIKVFSGQYLQDLVPASAVPVPVGLSASEQANHWLETEDVVPVSMTTYLQGQTVEAGRRSITHIIAVAWMPREAWEKQQARIMANAMVLRDAEKVTEQAKGCDTHD